MWVVCVSYSVAHPSLAQEESLMYKDQITIGKDGDLVIMPVNQVSKVEVDLEHKKARLILLDGTFVAVTEDEALLFISNNRHWRAVE